MKTKILILISFLMAVFLASDSSFATAQSVTTNKRISLRSPMVMITPEVMEEIADFATTLNANPIDINKDGTVDAYDTVSAQSGYAQALMYANSLPAAVRSKLDVTRDGKVTKLDLILVTGNIAKAAEVYERVNVPSFNFVDMPAFGFVFRGQGSQMIVKDSAQTFDSVTDYGTYQPATIDGGAFTKLDTNAGGAVTEEDAIVFGDLSTVIDRANYHDFNFTGDSNPVADENLLVVYNSNITSELRAKLNIEKANVLDASDAQIFSNLISKMSTVIDYVKYTTGADVFTMTDYSTDEDGNILVSFEAEQGHALTIVIGVDTGVILNSAETLSAYGDESALTVSESATRVYDSNGILQKAEYSASSYDSSGMLVSHIVESVKLDTASGAMENSYTEATNIDAAGTILVEVANSTAYDANGKVTGSSVTESHYSASGVLIERVTNISIPDSGSQSGMGAELLVQYAMDATGAVISTTVYNNKGAEIKDLGGDGYKDSDSIINSVKSTQQAELKAAKEAADLKASQKAEQKAAKEAAELKAAQEAEAAKAAAELTAAKEAAELKASQEKAAKEAAELKASQE
ncbi:MAG: hypothetical protein KJ661_05035, partial [Candidatus Omnitrophica bacterium]|nr:hypothetical protein [Candidatus Omnitrophota bacterium]